MLHVGVYVEGEPGNEANVHVCYVYLGLVLCE